MSQALVYQHFPWIRIHRLMYRWNLTNGKNVVQTEKDAKRLFPRKYGTIYTYKYMVWASTCSWVDLEKDIITKTIGRKSVMKPK
jgi:endonuclease-3